MIPQCEPYMKLMMTCWYDAGCPNLTRQYFEEELKPISLNLNTYPRERSMAFQEAVDVWRMSKSLPLIMWVENTSFELTGNKYTGPWTYHHLEQSGTLVEQTGYWTLRQITYEKLMDYIKTHGDHEPIW